MRSFWVVALVLGLAGCVTQTQQLVNRLQTDWEDAYTKTMACYDELSLTNEWIKASDKWILDARDPQVAYKMSIKEYASQEEIDNRIALRNLENRCIMMNIQEWSQVHPEYAPLYAEFYRMQDESLAKLIAGEITIGEDNANIMKSVSYSDKGFSAIRQKIQRNIENVHRNEAAQQAQANAIFAQWLLTQQAIRAANRPVVTNCTYGGGMASCVSQ